MVFIKNIVKVIFLIAVSFMSCQKQEKFSLEPIDYVAFVNEVIDTFIQEVQKEYGFKCDGRGGSIPHDIHKIKISFVAHKKVNINQARELEVRLIEKFRKIVNKHEEIRPFLRKYPFPSESAAIMIAFDLGEIRESLDKNVDLILQANNKIFFEAYDAETKKYMTIKEENYEDSLEIVRSDLKTKNQSL